MQAFIPYTFKVEYINGKYFYTESIKFPKKYNKKDIKTIIKDSVEMSTYPIKNYTVKGRIVTLTVRIPDAISAIVQLSTEILVQENKPRARRMLNMAEKKMMEMNSR